MNIAEGVEAFEGMDRMRDRDTVACAAGRERIQEKQKSTMFFWLANGVVPALL